MPDVLSVTHLTKTFPGVRALDSVHEAGRAMGRVDDLHDQRDRDRRGQPQVLGRGRRGGAGVVARDQGQEPRIW